jgi:predicted TPR repeat methyltransferase
MSEASGYRVALPPPTAIVDQFAWLTEQARGREVIHLGCVDDLFTEERLASGILLHKQLAASATRVIGVDISADGLATLADAIPGEYVHGDVEHLDDLDLPVVDLVIAAEIIEHLGSPGLFLEGLRRYLARSGATAIITTPNAFSWRTNGTFLVARRELTHPDHRLVYTPATLARALELAGLEVRARYAHTWRTTMRTGARRRAIDLLDRALLRWNPWLSVGLVVEVAARPDPR